MWEGGIRSKGGINSLAKKPIHPTNRRTTSLELKKKWMEEAWMPAKWMDKAQSSTSFAKRRV